VAGRPRDPREGAEYFPIIAADVPGQHLSQARRQKAYEAIEDAVEQDPIPVKDDVRINCNGAELGNHTRGLAHVPALPARAAAALLRWLDGGCATPRLGPARQCKGAGLTGSVAFIAHLGSS
jgi:hypothetical protein